MDLAGSGVNLYTTVHAPSAAGIPDRLASDFIGVSRDFMATPGTLKLLVRQVLLPRLCSHCALPANHLLQGAVNALGVYISGSDWQHWLDCISRICGRDASVLQIRNDAGCDVCSNDEASGLRGYAGRTIAAEYIEPEFSPGFLETIRRGSRSGTPTHDALRLSFARHENDEPPLSALGSAFTKAFEGGIDPRDIEPRFHSFESIEQNLRSRPRKAARS